MALADKARGQRISTLRKRKRLTQQVMAERLGTAYRTVQAWESGTMPEWHNLERLAALLDVRVEDIIGEDDTPIPAAALSQLSRIESKLDEILALLKQPDPLGLAATLEPLRAHQAPERTAPQEPAATRQRRRRAG